MISSKRSPRAPAVCLAAGSLFAVFAASGAAFAQRTAQDIASARQLYNEGIALRDKGDMKGALEKLKAAHALGNTPITGLDLCRAHAALSQPIEAREACLAVGRIPPLAEETPRSKDARSDAARLAEVEAAKIGAIRLEITGVPAGARPSVVVDGEALPAAALGQPRAVNPGVHTIVAKVGSGPETRATLETRAGEARDLELAVQAPPPEEEAPAPVPVAPIRPPEKKNGFATASFIVAGASGAIGAIAGLVAISKKGDLEDVCAAKICGRAQWDDLDSAKTWGTASTAFFVVGGVALGAGLVSTIAGKGASRSKAGVRVTPVVGLGGGGLRGTF
jgi:hypothetical protein